MKDKKKLYILKLINITYNYENNDCGLDTVNSLIADDIKITNIRKDTKRGIRLINHLI